MRYRLAVIGLSLCIGIVLPSALASAQPIGAASQVQTQSFRTPAGGGRVDLDQQDAVFTLDQIATDPGGAARLDMIDDTVITVGPQSEVVLDQFLFDPASGNGDVVSRISVGGLRFISGQMPSDAYIIETPVAVIGLRGTDVTVLVAAITGATRLIVLIGDAWIRPLGLETVTQVPVGRMVDVASANAVPQISPAAPLPGWARGVLFEGDDPDFPGADPNSNGADNPGNPDGPSDPGPSDSGPSGSGTGGSGTGGND